MNREQWLMAAVDHLVPIFEARGYSVPAVKVSVGFPSTGEKRASPRTVLAIKSYRGWT